MPTASLSPDTLYRLLGRRDLTDSHQGPHALQLLLHDIHSAIAARLDVPRRLCRILPVRRQLTDGDSQASLSVHPEIPGPPVEAMDMLALDAPPAVLLVCPGPVFGRADDGRVHLHGHRLALWYVGSPAPSALLPVLVQTAMRTALPDRDYRLMPVHIAGLRAAFAVEAHGPDGWVHAGHCGIASDAGVETPGVVLELEPLLVLRKALPDAALVHGADPAVQSQMQDLSPYRSPLMEESG